VTIEGKIILGFFIFSIFALTIPMFLTGESISREIEKEDKIYRDKIKEIKSKN
jgi:hypothetical protein